MTQLPLITPSAQTELITPEKAFAMLSTMIGNQRKPSSATVKRYAAQMLAGKWGMSILHVDTSGHLFDGQHRLLAVIASKTPTMFTVLSHLPPKMAETLDIGRNRTAVDISHIKGHEWIREIHVSTAICMFTNPTTSATMIPLSHDAKIEFVVKHKEAITFSVGLFTTRNWKNAVFTSVIARAYYSRNQQKLEQFAKVLSTGSCPSDDETAATALREFWLTNRSKRIYQGSSGRLALIRVTTAALHNFLLRKPTKQVRETHKNYFPVSECDHWWLSKLDKTAQD